MTLRELVAMLNEDAAGEFKDHLDKELHLITEADGEPQYVLSMYVKDEFVVIDIGKGD